MGRTKTKSDKLAYRRQFSFTTSTLFRTWEKMLKQSKKTRYNVIAQFHLNSFGAFLRVSFSRPGLINASLQPKTWREPDAKLRRAEGNKIKNGNEFADWVKLMGSASGGGDYVLLSCQQKILSRFPCLLHNIHCIDFKIFISETFSYPDKYGQKVAIRVLSTADMTRGRLFA